MASTTTVPDPPADNHFLRLDSLPLVDLNLLSQTELYSLSLCSSASHRCDDDVLIPKIDRSVFNESAGSRKQTYSRLRLAPRNSQLASSRAAAAAAAAASSITRQIHPLEPLDQESAQIIGLLKHLFASETHDDLVPVRIDYNDDSLPRPFDNVVQSIPIDVVFDAAQKKRKRGRPRKDANLAVENHIAKNRNGGDGSFRREVLPVAPGLPNSVLCCSPKDVVGGGSPAKRKRGRPRKDEKRAGESGASRRVEVKEEGLVHVNRNGNVVDLVALGNMEDPFGEELRKRTEGLETEAELLGFLGGLDGEWASKMKKIVQASEFGDALPRNWKIMLSVERKQGRVYLFCRRYIRFLLTLAISLC